MIKIHSNVKTVRVARNGQLPNLESVAWDGLRCKSRPLQCLKLGYEHWEAAINAN